MSNFLREVLIDDDQSDLADKIELIKKKIAKLKSVINVHMKDKYAELKPNIKPDEVLINKSEKVLHHLHELQTRIDEQVKVKLISTLEELKNLSLELKEYNFGLNLSGQLLDIHKGFHFMRNFKNNEKPYATAAMTLIKLQSQVIEESCDIQQLNIYESLKVEYNQIYDKFTEELNFLWREKIFWDGEMTFSEKKCISLHVKCNSDELTDIFLSLHHLKKLSKCIEALALKLLEFFIHPIIHSKCSIFCNNNSISLEIIEKKQSSQYKSVLKHLQLLFQFLDQNLNFQIDNECFLTKLSIPLLNQFSKALSNDCIANVLPTSTSELETFGSTLSEIEDFQNYLLKIKFINDDQKFLSEYTQNVDKIYIDKKCEKLLDIARSIMKKDLHDSFRYKPESIKELSIQDCIVDSDIVIDRKLSKFTFFFPECQISKSAKEILNLVEEILEEACNTVDKYVSRLFYTSRNIFEMYAALVPEIHKSFIETIPQQVALFHNNCFYLAHHLLMIANKYKNKLQVQDFSIIYVDQVLLLRQVGSRFFLNHMKFQRDIIFEILRDSGLSSIGHMPNLPESTERAFRQCIRQLELLKTIWRDILPLKVYCRVIGCLVNDMVEDICLKVIKLEDIPADIASELVTLFNMVIERIPKIFPDPVLIVQHVQKWRRLKELNIVLGASLRQIEERWADGKGPLAHELLPQEVKQLIRALFQNTERRSNLLSKIKDK